MRRPPAPARRHLLKRLAICLPLLPAAAAALRGALASASPAASTPLLPVDSPEAKAVKYVEDARQAPQAAPGSNCASCGLYQGPGGSAEGPCQLFPGKAVKASGWCSSWAPQL